MYRTREANAATMRQVATLASSSTLVMSFLLPLELAAPEVRPGLEMSAKGSRAAGTPFISFYGPEEILALARESGFRDVQYVPAVMLNQRYFAGRTDGLHTSIGEELLVATT